MKIIAFDPGGTTGVAEIDLESYPHIITTFEFGPHDHEDELWNYMINYYDLYPHIIICEDFKYRQDQRSRVELISVGYKHILILFHKLYSTSTKFILQSPSNAKTFVTDPHLKKLGFWKGKSAHERDAVRHLIYYLCTEEMDEYWLQQMRTTL